MTSKIERIAVIGGGLAGPLLSIYLARRGYHVDLYERRPDLRKTKISAGRSINLAISARGIFPLRELGLFEEVQKLITPMKGRMMHSTEGTLTFQKYGRKESETNDSISRPGLNKLLLDLAEKEPKIRMFFHHRCTSVDFEKKTIDFRIGKEKKPWSTTADLIIGTDGASSAVRESIGKATDFDFSQEYLEHGYKELTIPADNFGNHRLEKNALHIWPRGSFMLIALPNQDGSFTCTVFLPFSGHCGFESLNTSDTVRKFFKETFADTLEHLPDLEEQFFENPTSRLSTIRCRPWHLLAPLKGLILGDAAHAIVPFFGQGMNCSFEDCTVLNGILDETNDNWDEALPAFEGRRRENTDAIADMALENFVEMRDLVADPHFLLKKKAGLLLEERYPEIFVPRYSLVMFHRIPYMEAKRRGMAQAEILETLCEGIQDPAEIDWNQADELIRDYGHTHGLL